MIDKIKKENFQLKKLKISSGGSLAAEFNIIVEEDNKETRKKFSCESDDTCHPDLRKHLEKLDNFFMKAKGMCMVDKLEGIKVPPAEKKAIDRFLRKASEIDEETEGTISASGLTISRKNDETYAAVISARVRHKCGKVVGTSTPLIVIDSDLYGIEEELHDLIIDIQSETFEYVFNDKKNQLSLELPEGQTEEEEAA